MREIIPNVRWMGNAFDARNVKAVMAAGFRVAVDVAIEEAPHPTSSAGGLLSVSIA